MRVAIHQPNFLPYVGYFHKMAAVDQFVLYDDVQFTKEGFTSRNRIKTPTGTQWITVPVLTKGRLEQRTLDVEIVSNGNWHKKVLGSIRQSYGKSPHFKAYYEPLEQIMLKGFARLVDLNIALIEWVREVLGIRTLMIRSSTIPGVDGSSTERIISICKALGADSYYSGKGGANYQDQKLYDEAGIQLVMSHFSHPTYPQLWGTFEANLSVIDLVFNVGPESHDIICG